jgi:hypothetical protein
MLLPSCWPLLQRGRLIDGNPAAAASTQRGTRFVQRSRALEAPIPPFAGTGGVKASKGVLE